jgi:adenosylcobyric acid synthase
VLNRFRGDAALLEPGPSQLEELTGVPVLGVVPWLAHGLPDEDGASAPDEPFASDAPRVAIVRYPAASNLDEFKPLERVVRVTWATTPQDLDDADLVVLPGSKHVANDLEWLRAQRLDYAIAKRVATGRRVLAICGGLQMLGGRINDESGVEGTGEGLGFLPVTTSLEPEKRVGQTRVTFGELEEPWQSVSHTAVNGYEIRHGKSDSLPEEVDEALPDGLGVASGPILAVYLHGLFENPAFTQATLGVATDSDLDAVLDDLAGLVEPHLDMQAILALLGPGPDDRAT